LRNLKLFRIPGLRGTDKHLDTLIILLIWFIGPFYATLTAVRFSILFSAPIAIGSAIILSKILSIVRD